MMIFNFRDRCKKSFLKVSKKINLLTLVVIAAVVVVGVIGCQIQSGELLALEITSPQNNAEVTEDVITVSGIVSPTSVAVSVNGQEVAVAKDGTFSGIIGLEYGKNTVSVSAAAEGQELVTKTMTVTRLLTLEVSSPQDKAEVAYSPVIVRGLVSDPAASVTVNGNPVKTADDGTFFTSIELNYVKNTIVVQATVDGQGPVTQYLSVNRILVLNLDPIEYGSEVTDNSVTISGVVCPPSAVVTVNGEEVRTTKDGHFSTTVDLGYGENVIMVHATDPVTRTVFITRVLTMEIISPKDGIEVHGNPIMVRGTVSDTEALVTINGAEVEVASNGGFSGPVDLGYGENLITVEATANGETKTSVLTITRILNLDVYEPQDGSDVADSSVVVSGAVSDPAAVITINGVTVETAEDGAFSGTVELEPGENEITVSAAIDGEEISSRTLSVRHISSE